MSRRMTFPEEAHVEYERSVIRIPIYLPDRHEHVPVKRSRTVGWPGEPAEILENDAFMRLQLEPPTVNYVGYRQFEFQIQEWELIGRSEVLGADFTFTLSKTVQPKSLCRANGKKNDFPAEIYYSAVYDVYIGADPIIENQPGIAYARGVKEIPPRDVTVAFEKPFESKAFFFGPGCCIGMRSITLDEFEEGKRQSYSLRGW